MIDKEAMPENRPSNPQLLMARLKTGLLVMVQKSLRESKDSFGDIAKEVGTSRARIWRIANGRERFVSIETLLLILVVTRGKLPFQMRGYRFFLS